MREDMAHWTARPSPLRRTMEGHYVRLEPLDAAQHGHDLYKASAVADAGQRFLWLGEYPPSDEPAFIDWVHRVQIREDPLYWAIIDEDWPALKAGDEAWLSPQTFDAAGQQRQKLGEILRPV